MARRLRSPFVWGPISLILLAIVVWRSRIWDAGSTIQDPAAAPLLAAIAMSALLPVLWAIRSSRLLAASDSDVPIGTLLPMTTLANMINNVTPGSVGELLRLYLLRVSHGVPYVTGTAVIIVERLGALGYLTLSAVIAWLSVRWDWPAWLTVALLVLMVVSPGVLYRLRLRPLSVVVARPLRWVARGRWARASDGLARAEDQTARLLSGTHTLGAFALTTGLIFCTNALQVTLVAAALGVSLDPLVAWGALGLSITVGVLSLLPFGLGAADLTLVALLGIVGVPPAPAAGIALGYRLVSTLPVALAGVAAYAWLSARLPTNGIAGAADAASAGLEVGGIANGDDRR